MFTVLRIISVILILQRSIQVQTLVYSFFQKKKKRFLTPKAFHLRPSSPFLLYPAATEIRREILIRKSDVWTVQISSTEWGLKTSHLPKLLSAFIIWQLTTIFFFQRLRSYYRSAVKLLTKDELRIMRITSLSTASAAKTIELFSSDW